MKISISRDEILNPLQMVNSVIERRQTLPILSNVNDWGCLDRASTINSEGAMIGKTIAFYSRTIFYDKLLINPNS